MSTAHELDKLDMNPATLEREWLVTVDTPEGGVDIVLEALGRELPLVQGPYDNCLFVCDGYTHRIEGLPEAESEALLQALFEHLADPRYHYIHEWHVGDLLMWDNCAVQHKATNDYELARATSKLSLEQSRAELRKVTGEEEPSRSRFTGSQSRNRKSPLAAPPTVNCFAR